MIMRGTFAKSATATRPSDRPDEEGTGPRRGLCKPAAIGLALILAASAAPAQQKAKSADEVAKELSNPAGALASPSNNIEYTTFKGNLPGADDQDSWSYTFQPVLPFPMGDEGRRVIFRPLVPVPFDQPFFNANTGTFDSANGCQITGPLLLIGNPRPFGTEAVRQHLVRELLHGRDHVPLSGTGNGTFDFLGFTHYWARSRRGYWVIKRRTARKRLRRAMKSIWMS